MLRLKSKKYLCLKAYCFSFINHAKSHHILSVVYTEHRKTKEAEEGNSNI